MKVWIEEERKGSLPHTMESGNRGLREDAYRQAVAKLVRDYREIYGGDLLSETFKGIQDEDDYKLSVGSPYCLWKPSTGKVYGKYHAVEAALNQAGRLAERRPGERFAVMGCIKIAEGTVLVNYHYPDPE